MQVGSPPKRLRPRDAAWDWPSVTLSNCVCVPGVPRNIQNPKINMAHRIPTVLGGILVLFLF